MIPLNTKAKRRLDMLGEILKDNESELDKLQTIIENMIGNKKEKNQIETCAIICATIINGFDTNLAQDTVISLTKEIIESQR